MTKPDLVNLLLHYTIDGRLRSRFYLTRNIVSGAHFRVGAPDGIWDVTIHQTGPATWDFEKTRAAAQRRTKK